MLDAILGPNPATARSFVTPLSKADATEDLGPSVIDGVLVRTSVSGITSADPTQDGGCLRSFMIEKVLGQTKPEQSFHGIGKEVHAQIEHFLKTGEDVLSPTARAGRHFIPSPLTVATGLEIEAKFSVEGRELVAAGIPLVGFIDVINRRGEYIDESGELRKELHGVGAEDLDWKTTSSIEKWAKGPSALIRTVQMPGYAKLILNRDPSIERVRLSHVYFQTGKSRKAKKSTIIIDAEQIDRRWQHVESVVRTMIDVASETDPLKVDPNFNACGAFKGCPFRAQCTDRPKEHVLQAVFGSRAMSLIDKIKSGSNTDGTASPPPATTAPPPATSTAPPPVPGPVASGTASPPPGETAAQKLARLKREREAEIARLEKEEQEAAAAAEREENERKASEAKAAREKAEADEIARLREIEKQAAAKASTTSTERPPPIVASKAVQGRRYWLMIDGAPRLARYICLTTGGHSFGFEPDHGTGTTLVAADVQVWPADLVLPPDAPASGESGAKADPITPETVVPDNVRAAAAAVAPNPSPGTGEPPTKPKTTRAPKAPKPEAGTAVRNEQASGVLTGEAAKGITLLVNAIPSATHKATNLDRWIDDLATAAAEEYKAADIRCAPKDSPLAFGGWKGAIAALAKAGAADLAPGTYYILARGSEIRECVAEALSSVAVDVILGV